MTNRPIHSSKPDFSLPLRLAFCVAAIFLVVAQQPQSALGDEPTAAEREEASWHVERGRALQAEGRYGEAIKQYRAAYRLIPHPQLLYNLGQAYRLKGEKRRALKLYKQYLDRSPDGATADLARRFIGELEAELEVDKKEPRKKVRDKKIKPKRKKRPKKDRSVADTSPGKDSGKGLRRTGLIVLGVGAIGIGAGVGLGARASSIGSEFDGGVWEPKEQSRYEAGKNAQKYMYVAYGVGAAAVLLGASLYVLGSRSGKKEDRDLALGASVGESEASVWLSGRF